MSLFAGLPLVDWDRQRRRTVIAAVRGLPAKLVLGMSVDDLAARVAAEFRIEPLRLRVGDAHVQGPTERFVQVDDPIFAGRVATHRLVSYTVVVPFDGSADLWELRPPRFEQPPLPGRVDSQTIRLSVELATHASDTQIRAALDGLVNRVDKHLRWGLPIVQGFNPPAAIQRAA